MNKLFVPLDFNDSYQNILRYSISLASKSKAELTLFYVGGRRFLKNRKTLSISHNEDPKSYFPDFKENELGENIKKTLSTLIQKGIQFQFKSVNGSVSRRVLKACKAEEYSLVIIGTDSPGLLEITEQASPPTSSKKQISQLSWFQPAAPITKLTISPMQSTCLSTTPM